MLIVKNKKIIVIIILGILSVMMGFFLSPDLTKNILLLWDDIDDILPFIKYILLILNFFSISVFTFSLGILPLVIGQKILLNRQNNNTNKGE